MDEVTWSYVVLVLAIVPWLVYAFILTFFVLSILYGRLRMHMVSNAAGLVEDLPGVTILKPLMGVETFLEQNLESHFNLQYPKFELLFCVADDQDPVIDIIHKLQKRHPDVDSRIFLGGRSGILNPLVHNMTPAYEASKYDVVWVSTSRILVNTNMLLDMVVKLNDPKVALVHQMPFTTDQRGLAAAIEKVYFGATAAKYFIAFHVLGISCITGMSYLVKKVHLEDVKGVAYFGKFLAEDFFLSKYLHDKGFRHRIAAVPAQQNVATTSIAGYKDRMVRWLRLRLNMMPLTAGIFEFLSESVPLGIYASWSAYFLIGVNPYLWFCGHWTLWCILDYVQLKTVQNGPLPFSCTTYVLAWAIRELLYIFIYIEAICNVRRIKWGRRTYYLSNFGESIKVVDDRPLIYV